MSMKKNLIALAVASAFAAPVAMAADAPAGPSNTSIYGAMNASIDRVTSDNGTASGPDVTNNHVSSNESRIGVKGSEDLGGGMSAIWQIESGINLDSTAGTGIGTRNTFVGLSSGDMGTVVLGSHDTPYEISTRKLDSFAYTLADNRSIMGRAVTLGHDTRLGNVLAYISPNFGGLSFAAATVFGSEGATPAIPDQEKSTTYSLAGMYSMGGIYGTVAYQTVELGEAPGSITGSTNPAALQLTTALKVGGSFSMDVFKVSAVYEMLEDENVGGVATVAGTRKDSNIYLAGEFNLGSLSKVKAAYTMKADSEVGGTSVANTGGNQMSIGYDHGLSPRTKVYALYTKISNETETASTRRAALGGTSEPSPSTSASVAGALDASAISVGVAHSF